LIGNDASAVQFVCREFFVYVDKNIFFSVKERAVELLGLEDDAVKLYCMKYCLGNYGGVFIPRMDRFFVEDEMILRVWGSFVGSKYRDLSDKGGAISRQIASVVARGVLGEGMDISPIRFVGKDINAVSGVLRRLTLYHELMDEYDGGRGDDALLAVVEAELQALTKGWGDVDYYRVIKLFVEEKCLLKELDWFAEKSGKYKCHSYLYLCGGYAKGGFFGDAKARAEKSVKWHGSAYFEIFKAYVEMGKVAEAIECVAETGVWKDRCNLMLCSVYLCAGDVVRAKEHALKAGAWKVRSMAMVEAYVRNCCQGV